MKTIVIIGFTAVVVCTLVHTLLAPVLGRPDTQAAQQRLERVWSDWAQGDNGR